MHPALAAAKCCLPWFFFGHSHFAHLATSMHFQHEWHRSKKQEGRGWGGGWPQKWHSLEMVEDFKTVRHVGGMKGWYWLRWALNTNRLHLSHKENPQIYLTSQYWSKEEDWQTAWQVTLIEEKISPGAIKFAIPHRRTKIGRLKSRDRVPDNVAGWTGNVFEFSSLLWNNSALNSFAPGGDHFKQRRHAENESFCRLRTKENSTVKFANISDNYFCVRSFLVFPRESGRVVTTNQVCASPGATIQC